MRVENTTEWKSEVTNLNMFSQNLLFIIQASTGSVVRCGLDGEFLYPNPWPQCNADINCGEPLPM